MEALESDNAVLPAKLAEVESETSAKLDAMDTALQAGMAQAGNAGNGAVPNGDRTALDGSVFDDDGSLSF